MKHNRYLLVALLNLTAASSFGIAAFFFNDEKVHYAMLVVVFLFCLNAMVYGTLYFRSGRKNTE